MKQLHVVLSLTLSIGPSVAMAQETAQEKAPNASSPDIGRGKELAPKQAAEIGVEGGYTQPFGTLKSGRPIDDIASAGGAVGLNYAYRIDPHWSVGLTGQFHESAAATALGPGAAVRGVAAGVIATYHFLPFRTIDPYASLGTGYRFLWEAPAGVNNNDMIHGLELGKALAGVDFRISRDAAMGPIVGADVNLFLWDRLQATGANEDIQGVHPTTFIFAGIGGRFDIGGRRVPEHQTVARVRRKHGAPEPAGGPPTERPVHPAEASGPANVTIEPSILSACRVEASQAFFPFDGTSLGATERATLDAVADCLATGALRGRKVNIIGRADARGTDAYNVSLAEARAQTVARYLERRGVAEAAITTVSAGARDSAGTGEGAMAYARRVDIDLSQ